MHRDVQSAEADAKSNEWGTPGTPSGDRVEFGTYRSRSSSSSQTLLRRNRGISGVSADDYASERVSFDTGSLMSERLHSEISHRYEMDMREIGVGGYGKVFLAKDRRFKNRLVAIKKVVKLDGENDGEALKEVNVMKVLDHPSICRLFETYDQGRLVFFVIEYCEGGDLFDRFVDVGKLPESMLAPIVKQVASALKYAHSKGIAHRDLKLENICFCEKSPNSTQIKVIDWGLAGKFQHGKMKSNVGTSTYTAPEVLDAGPNDEDGGIGYTSACDLWSLGVIMYVGLSGKPPFWGSPQQLLQRMKDEKYPMSGPFWDTISPECKDLISRLLKADAKERASVDDVLSHPWLLLGKIELDYQLLAQVLSNLEQFSHAPDFFSLCVASVARQLDHRGLTGIREAFCMLDKNSDGILDMEEVKEGYSLAFGEFGHDDPDAPAEAEVEEIFSHLDLDGTGRITYTEFCAAGLGQQRYAEEHVLWAAFKTFDIRDDGRVSKEELRQVLQRADITQVWTEGVCEDVAQEVMDQYGSGNDFLNFQEWLTLMRECSAKHEESSPRRFSKSLSSMLGENKSFMMSERIGADRSTNGFLPDSACCATGIQRIYRRLSGT